MIPALVKLTGEGYDFKASLGYIGRTCFLKERKEQQNHCGSEERSSSCKNTCLVSAQRIQPLPPSSSPWSWQHPTSYFFPLLFYAWNLLRSFLNARTVSAPEPHPGPVSEQEKAKKTISNNFRILSS